MPDDPMEAIRQAFFEECEELLDQLEEGLLALQDGHADDETVGAVFRAVHSIKGGAGAFALEALTDFAHAIENVLERLRTGALAPEPDVVLVLLRAADVLADIVRATASGGATEAAAIDDALRELARFDGSAPPVNVPDAPRAAAFEAVPLSLEDIDADRLARADDAARDAAPVLPRAPTNVWEIRFEPLPGLLASGNEPLYLFRALAVLGRIEVTCDASTIPDLGEIDADDMMLSWLIRLEPSSDDLTATEIENVFDFADALCVLKVRQVEGAAPLGVPRDAAGPRPTVTAARPADGTTRPASVRTAPVPSSGVAADARRVNASEMRLGKPTQSSSVRVDLQRVDALVNLVGEIVIAQAMLSQIASEPDRHAELAGCLDGLNQLTLEVQDSVMAIRALPVKPLFQRMSRIVREAAQMTGKDVRLVTLGEDTQIDKTVIELLADPLTHMIRNAVDHGLEPAEARLRAGKPAQGTVTLSAAQRSDRVFVEISDDGRGIDRAKVLAKAKAKGLVEADASPDAAEIDRLLFLPGLSTSDAVSELSGRGVGMDVVNRAIQDLSGAISIASEPGRGTVLTVSLPLTLAILDGMVVTSRGERYVMPLASIVETQTLDGSTTELVAGGGRIVLMQDRYVPLHDLGRLLGRGDSVAPREERTILLVEPGDAAASFALVVDGIEAQRQVVVKGLGDSVGRVPGISAATILGDGQVALILDGLGLHGLARRAIPFHSERLAS